MSISHENSSPESLTKQHAALGRHLGAAMVACAQLRAGVARYRFPEADMRRALRCTGSALKLCGLWTTCSGRCLAVAGRAVPPCQRW